MRFDAPYFEKLVTRDLLSGGLTAEEYDYIEHFISSNEEAKILYAKIYNELTPPEMRKHFDELNYELLVKSMIRKAKEIKAKERFTNIILPLICLFVILLLLILFILLQKKYNFLPN